MESLGAMTSILGDRFRAHALSSERATTIAKRPRLRPPTLRNQLAEPASVVNTDARDQCVFRVGGEDGSRRLANVLNAVRPALQKTVYSSHSWFAIPFTVETSAISGATPPPAPLTRKPKADTSNDSAPTWKNSYRPPDN